jgi:anti-sigma B factor antagonist
LGGIIRVKKQNLSVGLRRCGSRDRLVPQELREDAAIGRGKSRRAATERGSMQLKLAKRNVDGILAVGCSGRIVFGEESSLLRDEVKKAIADGNKRIVLNLGEVSYIDSGGLGTLVALHTTAHNAGGTIKLANLTKRVGDLMQVTKLLTVFEVHPSEYEALEAFRTAA